MTKHPEDLLSAYIDKELNESEHQLVEEHLSLCSHCQILIKELTELQLQVSQAYGSLAAPQDIEIQILQTIDRSSAHPAMKAVWLAVPAVGVLCLIALLFLLGPVLFKLISIMLVAMNYALSTLFTSAPSLRAGTVLFSIMTVILSSLSLRRLLRTTSN